MLGADALTPGGFEDDEALLPVQDRALSGYRLLKEYAAFPARYLFARIKGLRELIGKIGSSEFELLFVTARSDVTLEKSLDASNFALHCTPAINLFRKRADRVEVEHARPRVPRHRSTTARGRWTTRCSRAAVGGRHGRTSRA